VIATVEHAEGCILPVRAQPGARKARVAGEQNGSLKLAVTAPPENGRANQALIEFLQELLDIKRSQIELVSGVKSREKRFLIRGVGKALLDSRLARLPATH
jgi:uncharacterized protein (TIGR00251 family)